MSDKSFTYDRWAAPDDPEFGVVRFDDLRKIERACLGIWAIARIVGNSANEPGATDVTPLHGWVVSNLMGGIESLCDRLAGYVDAAIDRSSSDALPGLQQQPPNDDGSAAPSAEESAATFRSGRELFPPQAPPAEAIKWQVDCARSESGLDRVPSNV